MNNDLRVCAAVLAAGQSRRFAGGDKLSRLLHGTMLGLHVCETLQTVSLSDRIVVTRTPDDHCTQGWRQSGFEILVNPSSARGLATSVAIAANWAQTNEADALLICLADMPFVPASHFEQLICGYGAIQQDGIIASSNGKAASPPAIFGKRHFARLIALDGNKGARQLIARARTIPLSSDLMLDIDTVAELRNANARNLGQANGSCP